MYVRTVLNTSSPGLAGWVEWNEKPALHYVFEQRKRQPAVVCEDIVGHAVPHHLVFYDPIQTGVKIYRSFTH